MRSISGATNRLALALAGILALGAAAWLGAAFFDLVSSWPHAEPLLAHGQSTPAAIAAYHRGWVVSVAAVVAALAILAGVALLLAQIPVHPSTAPLRLTADGSTLASIEPAVLGRALSDRIEQVPGVLHARVHATGTAGTLWLQASVTLADDSEIGWALAQARSRLAADVRTAFGSEPRQVDVLVQLRSRGSGPRVVTEPSTEIDTVSSHARASADAHGRQRARFA